jgi:small subunit ribosomal protein S5e
MADVAVEEPIEETAPMEEAPVEIEEEDFVPVGGATEVKLFGKWSFDDIEISDLSLEVSLCKLLSIACMP